MNRSDSSAAGERTPLNSSDSNVRTWLRIAGALICAAAILLAIIAIWQQRSIVKEALASVPQRNFAELAGLISVIAVTVVLNIVLSGVMFSALTKRYGRVGLMEMQALIGAASLLNYLPLRPGLMGRVAYHRMYNNIPVSASVKIALQAVGLSVASSAYFGLMIAIMRWQIIDKSLLWVIAVLPIAALAFAAIVAHRSRLICIAGMVRYLDLLINAVRYVAAFALIGTPIGMEGALAFAGISALSSMIPFLSNGLGIREWAVGLATPLLTAHQMTLGLTADLINRAAEMIIVGGVGAAASLWLMRLQKRRAHTSP